MPDRGSISPRDRFLALDEYRVDRELRRYEGTAQRELFRALRDRFLARYRSSTGWVADLGSGPGRFSDQIGPSESPRVLLDLSLVALQKAGTSRGRIRRSRADPARVVGDARHPPLRSNRFGTVALLGNVLGFAEEEWTEVLGRGADLLTEDGTLVLEAAAGAGERSRYLHRLPPGACARVLTGPSAWVARRVGVEGFDPVVRRSTEGSRFAWITVEALRARLAEHGLAPVEVGAIAPCLGADPERVEAARASTKAWDGLLALEEAAGRAPERWRNAAAYLVAARRSGRDWVPPSVAPPTVAPVRDHRRTPAGSRGVARRRRRAAGIK